MGMINTESKTPIIRHGKKGGAEKMEAIVKGVASTLEVYEDKLVFISGPFRNRKEFLLKDLNEAYLREPSWHSNGILYFLRYSLSSEKDKGFGRAVQSGSWIQFRKSHLEEAKDAYEWIRVQIKKRQEEELLECIRAANARSDDEEDDAEEDFCAWYDEMEEEEAQKRSEKEKKRTGTSFRDMAVTAAAVKYIFGKRK